MFEMQFQHLDHETNLLYIFFFFFTIASHWHVEEAMLNACHQHWSHVHKKWGFPGQLSDLPQKSLTERPHYWLPESQCLT